jgi:cyclopropane-fatty-acyl-phospholipid synthase
MTGLGTAEHEVSVEHARQATNTHYEMPPEYFSAFLDRRMKYSSGLYQGQPMSLDDAQTAKLRFVGEQLRLRPGDKLLDIGCGWGSLTLYAAEELGCDVTAITPAGPQQEYIRRQAAERGISDRVRVLVGAFTELSVDGRYDGVAMLGSIIHMPDRRRALAEARRLLRPGGHLYLSESCFRNEEIYAEFKSRPGTVHVMETTFGFADMVPLSRLVAAAESAGFSLIGLTDLTDDYYRTIEAWIENAKRNRATVDRFGNSEELLRYLEVANAGWGFTSKHYALVGARRR